MFLPRHAAVLTLLTLRLSQIQAQTLLPAVHWDHNKADLQHLLPADSHNLYYSSDGVAGN